MLDLGSAADWRSGAPARGSSWAAGGALDHTSGAWLTACKRAMKLGQLELFI